MTLKRLLTITLSALLFAFTLWSAPRLLAQVANGDLHGQVTDPAGAVIPNATITVSSPAGATLTATTDASGNYVVHGLAAGTYMVSAMAEGFAPLSPQGVTVGQGQARLLNLSLAIQVQQQTVQVNDDTPAVSTSPDQNANSVVIKGKDLDALSDDPDELQNELNALAGPGAGPNGGQIFIDGFTAGQLPPKSAIREIRVNQNPFSAEYDKLGYGRIEILTKPGSDKFSGQAFIQGNSSGLNTGNPFTRNIPPYYSYQYNGTLNGPINKSASFFFTGERRNIGDDAIIFAYDPSDLNLGDNALNFRDALPNPRVRTNISPRVDFQLGKSNTLTIRYEYYDDYQQNAGVGQFSLRPQSYNKQSTENQFQIGDTQILSDRVINETRFQYLHDRSSQTPASNTPQVQVGGAFTTGGNSQQSIQDHVDRYELWNLTEVALKAHAINTGFRLRITRDANSSIANFNGTFTFGGRPCPASGCPSGTPANCTSQPGSNNGCKVSALDAYKLTQIGIQNGQTFAQIRANGGGPSQLTYVTGTPQALVYVGDIGVYYQDDWKVSPRFTLSYGLRFESQTGISDHADWAPRVSFAYALDGRDNKPARTVLRGGFGIFYDRFPESAILQARRRNNIVQRETVIANPTCFFETSITQNDVAACGGGGSTSTAAAVYQISPSLRTPSTSQAALGVERQITKMSTFSLTYLYARGEHQVVTRNANAPYSPAYDPALGNIYQYYSEGLFNQNQLIANFNARLSPRLSFFGYYTLNYANSNANGLQSNPSNSENLHLDYGRAAFDARHRLFLIGSWSAPYRFRVSPFIAFQTGNPFNITLSQDENGDSFFTDRPSFAQPGDTNIVKTAYGTFNLSPSPGEAPIPIYFGDGPKLFSFNLRVSKSFGIGPRVEGGGAAAAEGGPRGGHGGGHGGGLGARGLSGGGGPRGNDDRTGRRYALTFNAQALNLFNNINLAPPTGVVDSPNFGSSNQLAGRIYSSGSASRRIFLQAVFSF